MSDVQLFTLAEVAEKTGLSQRALADAARASKMPHYRIQGRRYMSQAQIDAYLQANLAGPKGLPAAFGSEEFKARFMEDHARRMRKANSKPNG